MKTEAIKTQFEQAEKDLKRAKGELYQPMEDVVSYCVCVSARGALYRYLKTLDLLLSKDDQVEQQNDLSLEDLIQRCNAKCEDLTDINFSNINCKHLDVRDEGEVYFCNDVDIVNHCTDLAEEVREILLDKLPPDFKSGLPIF